MGPVQELVSTLLCPLLHEQGAFKYSKVSGSVLKRFLTFSLRFFLVLCYSSGHPGGDLPQPSSSSSGLRLPISVPPVERSGRQRVFVEGAMPTGGVPPARHLQNTLRLETVLLLVQEEKKSDQESKRG